MRPVRVQQGQPLSLCNPATNLLANPSFEKLSDRSWTRNGRIVYVPIVLNAYSGMAHLATVLDTCITICPFQADPACLFPRLFLFALSYVRSFLFLCLLVLVILLSHIHTQRENRTQTGESRLRLYT
jgi:hypothetical protein